MPVSPNTSYADIFTNTQTKTAPQALAATIEAVKRGQANKSHIQKAAEDFESVFLGQMMQAMMPAEEDSDALLGGGESNEIYNGMMGEQYAKQIAKAGGIGIAGFIERELLGQQEMSKDANQRNYTLGLLKMDASNPQDAAIATQQSSAEPVELKRSAPVAMSENQAADALVKEIFQGGNL
jgi:Rod binding domain-containing protein